ncbi:MAG: aconitate hydratase, partial [Alphaproteobacteria bacterium]|nr:aconitate hydratase [Alphaproteobacteria bacterium]
IDITKEPLGTGSDGKPVYLKDIWPTNKEVQDAVKSAVTPEMFRTQYADVFSGDAAWQSIKTAKGLTYTWDDKSTYVKNPPYFEGMPKEPGKVSDVKGARPLAILGDSITTDHISPAGSIKKASPGGAYLIEHGVGAADFNSYGSRRGNHEIMMRGTFANVRLKNEMAPGTEGGVTRYMPEGAAMPIYDAAMKYQKAGIKLIIVAGKEYGSGSSRDWAAKGTNLLGVRAVIAETYERIHRSNLVGMGVLPLVFKDGMTRKSLKLDGSEVFDITGVEAGLKPLMDLTCVIKRADGKSETIKLLCRIDTAEEVEYFKNGGILHYVLRGLAKVA